MASSSKRSWKLQEIMAHDAGVNCLALGHKSGRVLATGGDDKKVNLFAVGKPTCIMTLTGHTTPIDCVRFNVTEELVCAGSQTGALKVWDLEAAKLVRSLTGHKSGISCMDFHPYGDFLTTGSNDHSIKLWDVRRRGCIISFKGHVLSVNNVKFSPDGQWIASSGADGLVKLWDLRANKVIHEFNDHTRSVTSVEFHPHDFLLATGGLDRTVNFFELEHFKLVSSEKEVGAVKCLWFHPDGECLFTGVTDGLRIQGWEPAKIYDTLPVGWGKVHDIATANTQLIGASIHLTHVSVYVVDLQKVQPFGEPSKETNNSPFTRGQSVRKSFTKEKPLGLRPKTKTKLDVKTIEESTSGTDQEEDNSAGITYIHGYREVFKPNRALLRTPPPVDEPFTEPVNDIDPSEPQIITADEVYSLSIEDLGLSTTPPRGHVPVSKKHSPPELLVSPPRSLPSDSEAYVVTPTQPAPVSRAPIKIEDIFNTYNVSDVSAENDTNFDYVPPKYELQRQYSNKEISEKKLPTSNNNNYNLNGIKHSSSEVNLNINSSGCNTPAVTRANSFSRSNRSSSKIPTNNRLNDEHNFKESKQQQLQQNKPTFKKPDPPKPLGYNDDYGSRRHKPLEYDVDVGGHSSPVKKKYDQIPTPGQQPIGIDLEQFLPKNLQSSNYINRVLEQSNTDILAGFTKAHTSIRVVLHTRIQSLRTAYQYFESSDDAKVALERVMKMDDNWVAQDILRNLMARQSFWSLAVCAIILPTAHELIKSRVDLQNETGCEVVRATLRNFSSLIRSNVLTPCSGYSVDIPREERYEKCRKCYDALMVIRDTLETKQHVSCKMSSTFKDLYGELNKLCVE